MFCLFKISLLEVIGVASFVAITTPIALTSTPRALRTIATAPAIITTTRTLTAPATLTTRSRSPLQMCKTNKKTLFHS